jgi:hypothetical protein
MVGSALEHPILSRIGARSTPPPSVALGLRLILLSVVIAALPRDPAILARVGGQSLAPALAHDAE